MGIDATGGYMGVSSSYNTMNTLKAIGSTAFSLGTSAATIAAGAFGGPAASSAVSSLAGGITGGGSTIGDVMRQGQDRTEQLMMLQFQMSQIQQENTAVSNIMKSKHEQAMEAVRNMR